MEINTKHSLNPVPFMSDPLYNGAYHLKPFGKDYNNNLSNVAATNFILLGRPVPNDLAPLCLVNEKNMQKGNNLS